ncbi:MAG TPA: DNA polymerase III subunit delta [Kofleriaceae bacterium]|nr:DNA polymerase III subunit delta [Kofleriaceae bacterium]
MGIVEDAAAGKLAPVYILCSPEPLLVDRALAAIREAAVPGALRGFNEDSIDGRGATAARIVLAARTLPMMAKRRLVLVRDISQLAAAELAELVPYLDSPSPETVLVATSGKVDRRLKFYAAAGKKGFLHELAAPRDLGGWVADEARRREVAIAPPARTRLVEVVGADLSRLSLALEQLALYAGDRPISVDDVDDLVADTRERSVFELTDAIGAGDRRRALGALASLVDQRQSAIGVIAMLARHMRQLALYRAGRDGGMGKSDLGRLLGVPPFVVDKLGRQAGRYSDEALGRAATALSATDRALKGEGEAGKTLGRGLTERVLLARVVDRLLVLGGPG